MSLRLRGYQIECLDAIERSLLEHNRVAAVLATGLGKTVIFSHLAASYAQRGKVVVLVHRDELAEQTVAKLHSVDPSLRVGIVKAERHGVDADVLVCSVQTLARQARREAMPDDVSLVIVDECHHAAARSYLDVLEHFGCFAGDEGDYTPAVGFTATLHREDGRGLGNVWETVCYERDIGWAIEHGYLCDVRGQQIEIDGFNLADIARSHGDYQEGKLGDALETIGAGSVIARAYHEHATRPDGSLRPGVLFAPTVSSAETFAADFGEWNIRAECIFGTTSKDERADIYRQYEAGRIDVLCTAMVLTEGWDSPRTEVCVMARPTSNPALYTQCVGRVLRLFPGKTEALVLDVVGIAGRHQLRTLANLTTVTVAPGESLAEAQLRAEVETLEARERTKIEKAHSSREVELFANSHSVWLQTRAGIWFVPTAAGIFFLWPREDGLWNLGYKATKRGGDRSNGWVYEGLTMEYAMAHGDQLAIEDDPTVASRDRAWRKAKPSEAQLDLARRLKVAPIDELVAWRRGAVSDAISIAVASRHLDQFVTAA